LSCIESMLNRRSIRKYKEDLIPGDVKERILEAGRRSPSAVNRQPWHFLVVDDPTVKEKIITGPYCGFIRDSDFTIVGVCLPTDAVTRRWGIVDVVIAMQSMSLAAEVQGVGSCWIGDFKEAEIKEALNIPEEAQVVALMSFGIPDEKPQLRPKKPAEEIFHHNAW
jgi:nitroreductase